MSVKEIYSSSFLLKSLNENAYSLNVQFKDDVDGVVSQKDFLFSQIESPKEGEFLDLYSQNGVCNPAILNHLFEKRDEKDIQKIVKLSLPKGPMVLVLDLQDPHTQYSPCVECHRQ